MGSYLGTKSLTQRDCTDRYSLKLYIRPSGLAEHALRKAHQRDHSRRGRERSSFALTQKQNQIMKTIRLLFLTLLATALVCQGQPITNSGWFDASLLTRTPPTVPDSAMMSLSRE